MASVTVFFGEQEIFSLALTKDSYLIGRGEGCDIHIDNLGVSHEQARIVRTGDQYRVEDLNSTNGTFVNRNRITNHDLADGDQIVVGKHMLLYREEGTESSAKTEPPTPAARTQTPGDISTMGMDPNLIKKKLSEMDERQKRDTVIGFESQDAANAPTDADLAQTVQTQNRVILLLGVLAAIALAIALYAIFFAS